MRTRQAEDVHLLLPRAALSTICDECDRFDDDETGGRILGTYDEADGKLVIKVTGLIEAGPRAKRTRVSFFQDGEYQEAVFRELERHHPELEHLGNWHTHHVNGLSHLSDGDVATYRRTVDHKKQNTPFFYAMLVVGRIGSKKSHLRYSTKHYLFRRHDERIYEIGENAVEIVDVPLVFPIEAQVENQAEGNSGLADTIRARRERAADRVVVPELFEECHPYASKKLGFYWRGSLSLLDGSKTQVLVLENSSERSHCYSIVFRDPTEAFESIAELLAERQFASARAALLTAERICNRVLYDQIAGTRQPRSPK